jgi:stage II sporulation protein D
MAIGSSVIRSTNFIVSGAAGTSMPQPPAAVPATSVRVESLAEISSKVDPLVEMTKNNIFSKDEIFDMLINPEKRDAYLKKGLERLGGKPLPGQQPSAPPANPTSVPKTPTGPVGPAGSSGMFKFTGKGWGHGVGLSQWGAKAMADQGMKCQDILSHYFPGTKIAR